jgi:hypothetical protein
MAVEAAVVLRVAMVAVTPQTVAQVAAVTEALLLTALTEQIILAAAQVVVGTH